MKHNWKWDTEPIKGAKLQPPRHGMCIDCGCEILTAGKLRMYRRKEKYLLSNVKRLLLIVEYWIGKPIRCLKT